jgi:hypothetical protein
MAKRKAKKATKKKASGTKAIIIVSGKKARPGSTRALNPQPLPPKQKAKRKKKKSGR